MPVNKLSIQDFAAKIKAKYPDYKDVEDSLLTQKIIEKYPVYKDMVNYSTTPSLTGPAKKTAIGFDLNQLMKGQKPVSESTKAPAIAIPQVSEKTSAELHSDAVQNASNNLVKTFNENKDQAVNKIVNNQWTTEFKNNNFKLSSGQIDQKTHDEIEKNLLSRVIDSRQDVALFKQQMDADPTKVRQVVHEIAKSNPGKAKQLQQDMYLLDSQNRPEKANKILSNIHGIQKGDTEYDIKKGVLKNKQGFFESLTSGLQERNRLMKDYDYYNNNPDDQVINKLEQNRSNYDPDQPVNAPSGAMGHIGAAAGSQGIVTAKGVLAGVGTSAIPVVGEAAAPWVAAAITSPEFYKTGYTVSLENNYNEFRNKGDDPQTALSKARDRAKFDANVDVAQGVISTALGARMGLKGAKAPASPAFQNTLKNIAVKSGQWIAETGKEGVSNALLATGLQELKNIHAGRPAEQGAFETGMGQLMFAYGLGALTKAGKALITPRARQTILHNMANAPDEVVNEQLGHLVNDGTISHEEAGNIHSEIQAQKELDKKIPEQVENEGARIKIQELIKQRDELQNRMDGLDEAYHPGIKEQIKELNEKITDLSTAKGASEEKPGPTFVSAEDRNIQKQNEKIISGEVPSVETTTFLESRHADTKHDEQGVVSGPNDKELSTLGRRDANDLANDAKEKGVTKIISSDLERGKETARIVANKTSASVEHRPELNTWDIGDFDGTKDADFKEIQKWFVEHPDETEYKGDVDSEKGKKVRESFNQYKDRVIEARTKLENEPGSTLVINHSNNMMLWDAFVKNGHQWNEQSAKDYLNAQKPEPATIIEKKSYPKITNVKLKEDAIQERRPEEEISRTIGAGENIPGSSEGVRPSQQGDASTGARPGQTQEESTGQGQEEKGIGGNIPPNMLDLPMTPQEGEVSILHHAATAEKRGELGLPEQNLGEPKTDIELEQQAQEAINKGYDVNSLIERSMKGGLQTYVEHTILKQYAGSIEAKLEQMDSSSPEFDANLKELHRVYKASEAAGSEAGRAFRARRGEVLKDETLADKMIRDMDAHGVEELTEGQKKIVEKEHKEISESENALKEKIDKLEAENAKLKAEKELKKQATPAGKKKSHSEYVKERKDILEDARKALLKVAKGGGGLTSSIPGAAQLVAIAPHVKKMAKSLLSEGIEKLDDIVKNIHEQFKDVIPELRERDIHNIIAGEHDEKKPTERTLRTSLRDLQIEAQLINKLEAIESGEVPKTEKAKIQRNQRIAELRKKIKEHPETKLSDYKDRVKKQIDEVQKQLDSGKFEKEEKKPAIQLDKDAIQLQNKLIKLKQAREVRLAKAEYDKKPAWVKAGKGLLEVLNVPRTIMASMDFSAPLRQGLVASIAHPRTASKAFSEMFKAAFSKARFDRWFEDVKNSDAYPLMQKSDLYVSDPHNPQLAAKEEQFMNNLAEKIPGIGKLVAGSERAYVSYLNKMRVDLFLKGVDAFMSEGKTIENSPELYKGLAKFINHATGRGNLGPVETAAPVLNTVFFSPRLIASRLNLINPLFYTKLPKEVRISALRDMGKFIGFGASVIGLAALAGLNVDLDPRSSDFGKMKYKNTRWDIWGGFQQYIRLTTQLITGEKKQPGDGKIVPIAGKGTPFGSTRAKVFWSFVRGKLAPVPGTIEDFLEGRRVTGEKVTAVDEAKNLFLPLIYQDVAEAVKDQGPGAIFTVGIPSTFGVGVQTYQPKQKKIR